MRGGGGEEVQRRRHLTEFTLEMTCKERWAGARGNAKFGQPKNARQVQPPPPPSHTHTLPWLWLCATLIDVPAKHAFPNHAPY